MVTLLLISEALHSFHAFLLIQFLMILSHIFPMIHIIPLFIFGVNEQKMILCLSKFIYNLILLMALARFPNTVTRYIFKDVAENRNYSKFMSLA